MAFLVKQPNGRYCRFGTIVDCPTHINMTREDYISVKVQEAVDKAIKEAVDVLDNYLYPYEALDAHFYPGNMTQAEYDDLKRRMEQEVDGNTRMIKT